MNNNSLKNPPSPADQRSKKSQKEGLFEWISAFVMHRRFTLALKCSLSVGFAVLFGLIYSKQNGIWSGLPVAISFAASREAVFRVSNLKAQGTVLGTVYGVLGCFVLEKYVKVRFLILLPWFIFCSLLRRSRMYGPAGGVSAVIGAVLILGREHFGSPTEFAIIRIVEAFIGLSCSIVVELMFRPTRASTLAKIQLSKSLQVLNECICTVSHGGQKECLGGDLKKLKANVNELRKFIEEAEMEPNFWFLPFNGGCYNKLLKTLSNMVSLLVFLNHANASLQEENLSLDKVEGEELQRNNACDTSSDLELGKLPIPQNKLHRHGPNGEDEIDNIIDSYLKTSYELVFGEVCGEVKGHEVVLSSSAFAFCMRGLVTEAREIEKGLMELLQWENPSSHVNLYEISSKIDALYNI
ncbi:hypothetical protein HanHA300_Chr00c1011g0832081 [Helianthus annuus]|nr:hypothetical protein HanHA300_Chr00c1011g0832081 [Helianthus annuus]